MTMIGHGGSNVMRPNTTKQLILFPAFHIHMKITVSQAKQVSKYVAVLINNFLVLNAY
jgi:hypothetical protein